MVATLAQQIISNDLLSASIFTAHRDGKQIKPTKW